MSSNMHFYRPAQGHGLSHDPFKAIVAPRPIGWISSVNRNGVRNLAPYSFFNGFNDKPPIIGFSSLGYKDTVRNVEETGEFVWNLVTRPLAEAMNLSSAVVQPHIDEFVLARLTPAESKTVKAPRVLESPVSFECVRTQILQLSRADGSTVQTWVVFGEVVGVHISCSLLKNGIYDTAAAQPIARGGGLEDYFEITKDAYFRLKWPPVVAGGVE